MNDDGADWVAATYSTTDEHWRRAGRVVWQALQPARGACACAMPLSDDVGTLNSWSLGVGPAPIFSDAAGNYAFTNSVHRAHSPCSRNARASS